MDYLNFIQTHKNNFWNNLRLGKKGREWIKEYEDKNCDTFDKCGECPLYHWCSWYKETRPWEFIITPIENWLENHLWGWYKNHPVPFVDYENEEAVIILLLTQAGGEKIISGYVIIVGATLMMI